MTATFGLSRFHEGAMVDGTVTGEPLLSHDCTIVQPYMTVQCASWEAIMSPM